ncbi:TolC family protein [Pollutibacter soli]|uniref:TolC family protein n=1 Tax=Pollutibacter soli TaxID=3034157 RepID=UPI003013EEEA
MISRYSIVPVCLLYLLCSGTQCYSQQPLPIRELIARVNSHAPKLASDSAAIAIVQAREAAAKLNRLPSLKMNLQMNLGTNNNMPGGFFSNGIVPGNSRVRESGNSGTALGDLGVIAFDWPVYNFGGYQSELKVAHSDVAVERARYVQNRYDLQAFVTEGYLQLIRLNQLLNIQSRNIERNSQIRRSIQALAASGIIAGVDTSIAEAQLSKARLEFLELTNQVKQVQISLSALSGIDPDDIIPDSLLVDQLTEFYSQSGLQATDSITHPAVELYRTIYRNSIDRESMVKKSYLPTVALQSAVWGRGSSISPADEFRPLYTGFGFERGNYLVGIGITYNLFDEKRKRYELNTQRAFTAFTVKQIAEQQNLVELNIRQSDAELTIARDRLAEIPHQLEAAEAAYRQKFSLYRNGLTNIVELNAALYMLYNAETDQINVGYGYWVAILKKIFNENRLDEFFNRTN